MLSRTADNLYWLGRYLERAETMARLIDAGSRMSMIPDTVDGFRSEWVPILQGSGSYEVFLEKYGDPVERNVLSHLFFDRDNPSSVASCIAGARENARIVRTALSGPVWDALNGAYQEMKAFERTPRSELSISSLTEWTSRQNALVNGAIKSTLLRNDGFDFLQLGCHLERADNTARFLSVKYYVLMPDVSIADSGLANVQWQVLLRAMQMHRAFYWAYGGDVTSEKIVDLLILNPSCPQSLRFSMESAADDLSRLVERYGSKSAAHVASKQLVNTLKSTELSEIFDEGLFEFLGRFTSEIADISTCVSDTYLNRGAA